VIKQDLLFFDNSFEIVIQVLRTHEACTVTKTCEVSEVYALKISFNQNGKQANAGKDHIRQLKVPFDF
jgi:hypothetical protein